MDIKNIIIDIPADEYHASSRNGEFMSSHLLADFRESPALYYKEVSGEAEQTESAAFTLGRAAHSLILEGREGFDRDFIVLLRDFSPAEAQAADIVTGFICDYMEKKLLEENPDNLDPTLERNLPKLFQTGCGMVFLSADKTGKPET